MRYLYLDNVRGFSKTSVPLLDVNFLVGENSTGKTSLLRMWKLLTTPHLFVAEPAGDVEWSLGHFSEMVSAHSRDQSYFRIGWVGEHHNKDGYRGNGILLTFQKVEDFPTVTRLTCTMPKGEASFRIEGKKVFHRFETPPPAKNAEEMHARLLGWTQEHGARRQGKWKVLPAFSSLSQIRQTPLFVFLAYAANPSLAKGAALPLVMPTLPPNPVWIAPIRSRPRRTYDAPPIAYSPEGTHTPYVIRRILNSEAEAKKFKKFIEHIGEASGLFQKIDVTKFGDSETAPFELDAFVDDKAFGISLLGYGVSQSLPIFVELIDRPKNSWFAIQQPEVHLHPRAQAALGDAFFEMAARDNKRFVVETHSDFTIDRFRMNYRERKDSAKLPESQILFFERRAKRNVVTPIKIDNKGNLPADQPESYRKFFIREEMRLLGMSDVPCD